MNASRPAMGLDLSRLYTGLRRPAPRGIDQVELLYARHFLTTWPADCFSIVSTPWGIRLYSRAKALHGLGIIEALWGEDGGRRRPGPIIRRIAAKKLTRGAVPRRRHQQADIEGRGGRLHGGQPGRISQVGHHHLDRDAVAQLAGERLQGICTPGHEHQVQPGRGQPLRTGQAKAR